MSPDSPCTYDKTLPNFEGGENNLINHPDKVFSNTLTQVTNKAILITSNQVTRETMYLLQSDLQAKVKMDD